MKLRILGNSLRLRLTRSEVARLGRGERVEESVAFASDSRFVYRLSTTDDLGEIAASLAGSTLSVRIPERQAADWSGSEAVALQTELTNGEAGGLRILIEKDFFCLKPRQNQQEDE